MTLNKTIAKFVFYAVTVALLAWSGSLTVTFLSDALPNAFWMVPILGLVVFDGGMIAWLLVFLAHAQGAIQRAVALCLTIFDLIGVGLMVIAEILLDGQQLVSAPAALGQAAIWGIGVWTMVNIAGVIVFHLGDPEARKDMAKQAEKDAIWEGALQDLRKRRIQDQARLADELSAVMFHELVSELRSLPGGTVNLPTNPSSIGGQGSALPDIGGQKPTAAVIASTGSALSSTAIHTQPVAYTNGQGASRPND